jgi:DMSO/TMAO reductase YedYZ molybdopterin-dependent catalytic subunit
MPERTLDGSGRCDASIEPVDAYHPRTILAYEMNGRPLGIPAVLRCA